MVRQRVRRYQPPFGSPKVWIEGYAGHFAGKTTLPLLTI